MTIVELIQAVELAGKTQGVSRTQLAARLGISENYLYRLKTGDRRPGRKVVLAIIREFPELRPQVFEYQTAAAR